MIDDGHVRLVVDGSKVLLRNGHADGHRETLAQRTGGDFDAGREAVLRVTRSLGMPLAKVLQVVQRDVVAGKVQRAVLQHGRMAVGEDEAVAVGPRGVCRIVLHVLDEQQVGQRRQRNGRAGMAVRGLFDGIDCQQPKGVNRKLVEIAHSFL